MLIKISKIARSTSISRNPPPCSLSTTPAPAIPNCWYLVALVIVHIQLQIYYTGFIEITMTYSWLHAEPRGAVDPKVVREPQDCEGHERGWGLRMYSDSTFAV